jgi:hypothetical protein
MHEAKYINNIMTIEGLIIVFTASIRVCLYKLIVEYIP